VRIRFDIDVLRPASRTLFLPDKDFFATVPTLTQLVRSTTSLDFRSIREVITTCGRPGTFDTSDNTCKVFPGIGQPNLCSLLCDF